MVYATEYYYTDGKRRIPIAIFIFDGHRISFKIKYKGDEISNSNFDPATLPQQLKQIIHLPLARAELRARTMPSHFKPLEPDSMEHFKNIRHNTTYFKFSPVRQVSI